MFITDNMCIQNFRFIQNNIIIANIKTTTTTTTTPQQQSDDGCRIPLLPRWKLFFILWKIGRISIHHNSEKRGEAEGWGG